MSLNDYKKLLAKVTNPIHKKTINSVETLVMELSKESGLRFLLWQENNEKGDGCYRLRVRGIPFNNREKAGSNDPGYVYEDDVRRIIDYLDQFNPRLEYIEVDEEKREIRSQNTFPLDPQQSNPDFINNAFTKAKNQRCQNDHGSLPR